MNKTWLESPRHIYSHIASDNLFVYHKFMCMCVCVYAKRWVAWQSTLNPIFYTTRFATQVSLVIISIRHEPVPFFLLLCCIKSKTKHNQYTLCSVAICTSETETVVSCCKSFWFICKIYRDNDDDNVDRRFKVHFKKATTTVTIAEIFICTNFPNNIITALFIFGKNEEKKNIPFEQLYCLTQQFNNTT